MIPLKDNAPRSCLPLMTWGLIGVNLLFFAMETQLPMKVLEYAFFQFGVVPARIAYPPPDLSLGAEFFRFWPFLTCMFLHGGWIHVIGNMWTLWIFGDNIEDVMGPGRFLAFYLVSGIFASVVHVVTNPVSAVPIVGASGAIAGVMGAYYTLFPRAKILMVVPIFFFPFFFEMPAFFYLAFWFFEQVLSGTMALSAKYFSGGIAWWAHIGGFAFGMATNRLFVVQHRRC